MTKDPVNIQFQQFTNSRTIIDYSLFLTSYYIGLYFLPLSQQIPTLQLDQKYQHKIVPNFTPKELHSCVVLLLFNMVSS